MAVAVSPESPKNSKSKKSANLLLQGSTNEIQMKIYTKTGDEGQTGLLGGDRVPKDSQRIHAIGEIDELNAYAGICCTFIEAEVLKSRLIRVQNHLFDIGSELACPPGGKFDLTSVSTSDIEQLERELDEMEAELPPLKQFILPGGTGASAHLHFLRTICRRAERVLLTLHTANPVRSELIIYVNRLSDWIFCFSRLLNHRSGVEEQKWSKEANK
jgi:cob(I)alamin adenosyltransferase